MLNFFNYKGLLAAAVTLACSLAHSQTQLLLQAVAPRLTSQELNMLKVIGYEDPAYVQWSRGQKFDNAIENLRRSALIIRCSNISSMSPDKMYFDLSLRAGLEKVVDRDSAGDLVPLLKTREGFIYTLRARFWALSKTDVASRQLLWKYLNDPELAITVQHYRALLVLREFPQIQQDAYTGRSKGFPVLNLKRYFENAKLLDQFEAALKRTAKPQTSKQFSELITNQAYPSFEWEALQELTSEIAEKSPFIEQLFVESLNSKQQKALQNLLNNQFFKLSNQALSVIQQETMLRTISAMAPRITQSASPDRKTPPQQSDSATNAASAAKAAAEAAQQSAHQTTQDSLQITKSRVEAINILVDIDKQHPKPTGWDEHLYSMTPSAWVSNMHIPFCEKK